MPTDGPDTSLPPQPASSAERRGLRLGFGVAAMFTLGAGLTWPLWTIGAVFTNVLLQAPGPLPPKAAKGMLALSALSMAAVWYAAQVLLAYPVFFLAGVVLAIFGVFRFAAKGGSLVVVVLLMIAVLLIPTLLLTSPALAVVAASWLFANIAFAVLASWVCFTLAPPDGPAPQKAAAAPVTDAEATRHALRMTAITAPYALLHFGMGWTNVLPLIFIALLSTMLSGAKSAQMGKGILIANVLGGLVALCAYEVLVMAPFYPLLAALVTALVMLGAKALVSGGKLAPLAGPALNGFMVLLGGVLAPFGDGSDVQFIDRLASIGFAVAYVGVAYAISEGLRAERNSAAAASEAG